MLWHARYFDPTKQSKGGACTRALLSVRNEQNEVPSLDTCTNQCGTDVFAANMLSSVSLAGGDKSMKPMAFYRVFILVCGDF